MKELYETLLYADHVPSDDEPFTIFESEAEYLAAVGMPPESESSQYTGASASVFRQA